MDDNNLSDFILKKLKSIKSTRDLNIPVLTYYKGTTTLDFLLKRDDLRLKLKRDRQMATPPFGFIINTIRSTDRFIGHFVAIVVQQIPHSKRIIVRYFDSLGGSYKIYKTIMTYIHNIKKLCVRDNYIFILDMLSKELQFYDSKVCGLYCAYFITKVYETRNILRLRDIFANFKKDKIANDLRVIKFLKDNYPTESCHNVPIYSNTKATLKQLIKNSTAPPLCPQKTLAIEKCFENIKCDCDKCCSQT